MVNYQFASFGLFLILNFCVVATSMNDYTNNHPQPSSYFQQLFKRQSILPRQDIFAMTAAQGIVDALMYGLAGIPVYKAVETLLPLLKFKKMQNNSVDNGRVINSRHKRDLAYAQQLLSLLISLENALEKYGITEPQCQLRATCEIHQRNANKIGKNFYERNVIKLVSEMRREIKNPKVIPLAKYVFEYYEEAAERGEQFCNCKEMYDKCPYELDYFYKRSKGKPKSQW